MRTYEFLASRPGGFMNWPGRFISTELRIRQAVIIMFRKWFGREPNFHWHSDGFMAEATDERGNCVELHQLNDGDPRKAVSRGEITRRAMTRFQREFARECVVDGLEVDEATCKNCGQPLCVEDRITLCVNCRALTPAMLLEDRQ